MIVREASPLSITIRIKRRRPRKSIFEGFKEHSLKALVRNHVKAVQRKGRLAIPDLPVGNKVWGRKSETVGVS